MPRNESHDPAYLWDMLDAARAISAFVAGRTFHEFQTDRMLRNAVERNMEIIGEAANRISENFQKSHPEIPWRNIIGQRNILIHEYGEVKNERIWVVATERIPELVALLQTLLPQASTKDDQL
ncbi:MAG: DUF86 domain-containing protein [Smithellaceae bacterium]|nr:DUF86 domain-containing protein [Smithellaceae bacterium]